MFRALLFLILDWIFAKLAVVFQRWIKSEKTKKDIKKEAKERTDKLEKAETEKEREDATDDLARNSF